MINADIYSFPPNRTEQDLMSAVNLANEKMPQQGLMEMDSISKKILGNAKAIYGWGISAVVLHYIGPFSIYSAIITSEPVSYLIVQVGSIAARIFQFAAIETISASVINFNAKCHGMSLLADRYLAIIFKSTFVILLGLLALAAIDKWVTDYKNSKIDSDNKIADKVITAINATAQEKNKNNHPIIEVNNSSGAGKLRYVIKIGNKISLSCLGVELKVGCQAPNF